MTVKQPMRIGLIREKAPLLLERIGKIGTIDVI
jgi:hypothetical protein